MFYAASEIVFWILLATIVGGGIGYGLAQAKSVRLNQRLSQSRADAPMERELAIAWDTIEDLNRRLQVAHETIRDTVVDVDSAAEAVEADELTQEEEPQAVVPEAPITEEDKNTVVDMSAARPAAPPKASNGESSSEKATVSKSSTTSKAKAAKKAVVTPDKAESKAKTLSDDTVGTRLSQRVASASMANNNVDFTDGDS